MGSPGVPAGLLGLERVTFPLLPPELSLDQDAHRGQLVTESVNERLEVGRRAGESPRGVRRFGERCEK
mgnify:CR=1 FL=1